MDRFSDRGSIPLISTKSKRPCIARPFAFGVVEVLSNPAIRAVREWRGSVVAVRRWELAHDRRPATILP